MAVEIERKFLIKNDDWKVNSDSGVHIKQGYLNSHIERVVRNRLYCEKGVLTVKGKTNHTSRLEFEYEIPYNDAIEMLELCEKPIIEKIRYEVEFEKDIWEIDVFEGDNKGLIVAEIELSDENQKIEIPNWIGKEVSHESKYYNAALISMPFSKWI